MSPVDVIAELADLVSVADRHQRVADLNEFLQAQDEPGADNMTTLWSDQTLERLSARASSDPSQSALALGRFVVASTGSASDAERLAELLRDRAGLREVHVVPEGRPAARPISGIELGALWPTFGQAAAVQQHHRPPPMGMNARSAWHLPNGNGDNVTLIVVEKGWASPGPELAHQYHGAVGDVDYRDHGASTLGILVAADLEPPQPVFAERDLEPGIVGIVPGARVEMIQAVGASLSWLQTLGDRIGELLEEDRRVVVLISLQYCVTGESYRACTSHMTAADAAPALSSLRTLIAEDGEDAWFVLPMGNSGVDITADYYAVWPDGVPGPALRVSACESGPSWERLGRSNYSPEHTTCYAPGDGIRTIDRRGRLVDFTDTSAASAVIAGMAASLRSVEASFTLAKYIDSLHQIGEEVDWNVMPAIASPKRRLPDHRLMIEEIMGDVLPDIFVRDSPADDGATPSVVSTWDSPDIIVDYPLLGVFNGGRSPGRTPIDLEVRVRVHNRGPVTARNVVVRLFHLTTQNFGAPEAWTYVKSALIETIDPNGSQKTDRIHLTLPPRRGGEAFVAVIDSPADPMPDHNAIASASDLYAFVREHNNVAMRSVNIVHLPWRGPVAVRIAIPGRVPPCDPRALLDLIIHPEMPVIEPPHVMKPNGRDATKAAPAETMHIEVISPADLSRNEVVVVQRVGDREIHRTTHELPTERVDRRGSERPPPEVRSPPDG